MDFGNNQIYIARLLLSQNLINEKDMEAAQTFAKEKNTGVVDALFKLNRVREEIVMKSLAQDLGMEFVNLEKEIEDEALEKINHTLASQYQIMPVRIDFDSLVIATHRPLDLNYLDDLRHVLEMPIDTVVATYTDILKCQRLFYESGSEPSGGDALDDSDEGGEIHQALIQYSEDEGEVTKDDAPVIRLVSQIIDDALKMRTSDIHLEPMEKTFRIRYRVDGVLVEIKKHPKALQPSISSRIKLLSGMKLAEKRLPQDGKIKLKIRKKEIDIRVSALPGTYGESIVMRILDKGELDLGISTLGFLSDTENEWNELIGSPNGVLLITGPTGSGKTTTLYSCLNVLNKPERKIITVEDPIEYQLTGINQVQVREDIGLTFSSVLRACLRQAPNIIMVGEIRDSETAQIAMNAAFTGHLVFSTLHTNDSSGAITRLIDQGIQPFLVASAVRAVLAQRLVRKICPECKIAYAPSNHELKLLNLGSSNTSKSIYQGEGCQYCNQSGYKGRVGIMELLKISPQIQSMIYEKKAATDIKEFALSKGMRTLREDAILKVMNGTTTVKELLRVTKIGET